MPNEFFTDEEVGLATQPLPDDAVGLPTTSLADADVGIVATRFKNFLADDIPSNDWRETRKAELAATQKLIAEKDKISAPEHAYGRFMQSFYGGLASIPEAAAVLASKPAAFMESILPLEGGKVRPTQENLLFQGGQALRDAIAKERPIDPNRPRSFLVDTLPSGAGSMASFIGTGGALKAVGLTKTAGQVAAGVAASGAATGGAEAYREAVAAGADDDTAFKVFAGNAVLGTTEAIPIAGWLNRLNKASGNRLKAAIIEGSEELAQEVFQQFGGNLIAKETYDPKRSLSEGLIEGGAAGFTLGSLMSLVVSAIGGRPRGKQPAPVSPREDVPPPIAREIEPAGTPQFFRLPEADSLRAEASGASDRVTAAIADRLPITGQDARLAGARDRLPEMGYAYSEKDDVFTPVRKVEPTIKLTSIDSKLIVPVKPVQQERLTGARLGDFQMMIGGMKTVSDLRQLRDEWDASPDDPRQQHAIELINERIASFNLPANAQPGTVTAAVPIKETAPLPPVKAGFVRMYHGGADPTGNLNGDRDVTMYYDYAKGYADKNNYPVWFVDVPESSPFMKLDEGASTEQRKYWINTKAPADVMLGAKLIPAQDAIKVKPVPLLPPKDIAIKIRRADGSTYDAGFNGWQSTKMARGADGQPVYSDYVPMLSKLTPEGDAWSTGAMLAEGETIVGEIPEAPKPAVAVPIPPATAFDPANVATVEVPVADIKLSRDVPNFKGEASEETGVVPGQELAGKYERTGTAPVVLWRRTNGDLEIITGRHRLDLARRNNEKTIPSQVVEEAQGFTKAMALTFDAEANIRDGQGSIKDYAHYFKLTTGLSEREAVSRGLLSRAKGKAGWQLARFATDDLYALWLADRLTDKQAAAIVKSAPSNVALQRVGVRQAAKGRSADQFVNDINAAKVLTATTPTDQMDMFGSNDSAILQMERMSDIARAKQRDIQDDIRAISGASKNPERARKLGVDVKDQTAVEAKLRELWAANYRWDDWSKDAVLIQQIRAEAEPKKADVKPEPLEFPEYPSYPVKGTPDIMRAFSDSVRQWEGQVRAWLETKPENKAIIWEEPTREYGKGNVKALTRNIGNPKAPWRITTYWNRDGVFMSSGHQEYATREAGLFEEGKSAATFHDKMPGRVMDEQEIQGFKLMSDIPDTSKLVWYVLSAGTSIGELQNRLRGTVIMATFVRDSMTDDRRVAFTEPITLTGDAKRLEWLGLTPVQKPFQVDDILIWKAPGNGEDVAVNYRGPLGTSQSVVVSKQSRLQLTVETSALRRRDPPPVFKTDDRVTFKPFYQRETPTTGVVQEIVNDGRGYNILSPLPGDPSRVVRVWLEDGDIEAAPPATPTLELDQPESVEEQKARLAREAAAKKVQSDKDRLAAEAAKKLKGTAGDLGQGDLLDEPDNLFGLPKPKKPVEASPQVPQKPLLDEAQADVIRKRMQDRLNKKQPPSGPGQAALTPKPVKKTDAQKADDQRNFNDGVQLGALYIQQGAHKFPEWRERMLTDFGPDIEPQLRSIYETAKITIESPGGEGAAGRPAGLQPGLRQPTERIVTARAEFTKAADEGIIPAELVQHLDEHQRQGAASALRSLIKRGAFLLASGTGAGKTRQALAVAHYYAKLGKKVIIITKAETIKPDWKKNTFGGSYDFDSRAMGVPMKLARDGVVGAGEIGITTYQNLARVEKASDKNTVLIYDESAALKNDSQQAKFGMRAAARADKVMFMSATPADKPEHIYYLAPIGVMEGKTIQSALRDLGMTLVSINKMVKEGTQWVKRLVTFWAEDQNVTDAERHIRFSALFDRMTEQGAALKHEISMDGVHVQVLRLTLPEEAHETMVDILRFFDADTIDDLQGLKKASVLMHQRRQQEPFKVAPAVLLAKRELNAGRQVVLFVSRVNESEVGKWVTVTGLGGERERIREVLMSSEGTVKTLREALHEAGIHDIAEIHGNADQNSLDAMADFQAGRKRVTIATIESGGTGINLDDIVGNRPRSMIVVTAPFDAVGNVQAAGRIWRLKTLSDARVFYLFGDTDVDQWNADIIGTKMSMLGAVVEGQVRRLNMSDPELVGTDDFHSTMRGSPKAEQPSPVGTVGVPVLDWKPFKTRAGKDKFVAPATKAFWDWYNSNGKVDNSLGLRPSKYQDKWQVWADQIPSSGEPSLAEPETTGGLSAEIAQPVIDAWRKANPSAPEVQIINEPERTQIGTDGKTYGVRGWWDGQKILVNLAFVADADAVREVLEHERIHPLLDTAQGEAAITSAIEQELGGDALAQIQKRYKQGANENPESYRRRSMAEWFAQLKESNQSLWQRIVARVREFLAKLGVVDLTDEEIGRAMLRKLEASAEQVNQLQAKNATVSTQPGLVRIGGASALTAYHGTPHKVDKFSTEKIGSGEGAQVYGYGLYFSENPDVARDYDRRLNDSRERKDRGMAAAMVLAKEQGRHNTVVWNESVLSFGNFAQQFADGEINDNTLPPHILSSIPAKSGGVYTVDLKPNPEEFLDWDKPLSAQSEKVRDVILNSEIGKRLQLSKPIGVPIEDLNGESVYDALLRRVPERYPNHVAAKDASETLSRLGIKGIKYLDQGSRFTSGGEVVAVWQGEARETKDLGRGKWYSRVKVKNRALGFVGTTTDGFATSPAFATRDEAQSWADKEIDGGTYNFVIFDDRDITITHENGQRVSLPDALAEQQGSASLTQEPVGDDTKQQRTFGADIGEDQNIENVKAIQAALVENGYGIGDTVTPENTQKAWEQFASFVDPAKRADTLAALHAAVPQEMAPGIVHSTLWQYAVRLAATGDPALFRAMTANSNQFVLWDGPTFRSTLGRGLRALGLGADFTTWKNELERTKAQRAAIAKELGINPKDINLLDLLVVNLNGATPDADELAKAAARLIGNQAKERDLTADELYVLMSKLIFPVGTTGIEIKPAPKVLQRIAALFPTAGIREMFEKQGASGLARDLWQLLAGPQKPAGSLWTAQAAIRGQLGQILKEAMQRAGIEQANRPPTITSEEKLAKFLGDKETRQNIVARVDAEVRAEIEQRQAEEIEAAGDNETLIESIEQKYEQLEDAWRDATSSMLVDTASEALLGRMVRARLKMLKPDWSLLFSGKRSLADVRSAVISGITEDVLRVANQGRTPEWLSDAQVGFGEMFDRVASLEKNRYEMNLIAKHAQEQLRLTGKPEQQADALLSQFAREQSDTPSDQRAFAKNEVREAFKGYLSGDITAEEFRATLSSINVSGAKTESLLGVADRELASRKLIAQLREQERIERAKAREIQKLKEQGNVTAAAMLKRLQQDYAGVDWIKPATVNAVQQILRDHYKGREPILPILGNSNRVIDALAGRFTDEAGVEADLAQQLANAAEVKRQSDWTNARNRAIQRAKNSGSLRGLIDEILATPYLAQANPQWVRETAINWFLANGLSREQAEGATAIFQREFAAKLLEAQIKVAERLLAKSPAKNLRDFIEALRAGVLDPDKPWLDAYAKKAGWNVPTRAQFQRLAELELKLQDPNLSASEQAETTEAMTGIYLHLKLPPALMQRIAANFVVTALTGIRTMTVNLFAPLERLVTETALRTVTRPQDFARNIQTLFNAYGKNWAAARRMKFSLHKDAYTFLNNEFTQATNEQRRLWEEAEADFASGDNVRQTKAMVKGLYGSQQFAMRLLNAADQANAMAEREVQLLNYGSAAFREAGLGTQAVTALVQAASRLKQAAYETAIQQGRSPDQAQVDADEVAIEQLEDFVAKELANTGDPDAKTKARQMVEAATKDAYSAIGRLAPGVEETDEGGIVSRAVYHNILKASNFLRGGKGADPILGVSLLGYVSIPFRTGRHMLWNGPYGLLRLGIHHFRKGRGADNQWKQTLANEYQERQRLRLALAGTAAWAMIGALGFALLGKSGDDDAGEEDDFGFYVTGRGPKSKNLRDAWLKSGFRENSLVAFIFGKPIAIPMTRVGEPLAHLFWLLSARDDHGWRKREAEAAGKEFKETWSATTGRAAGTYLGMVGQRGLLQNITQWARIGSGEGGSDKVLADLASKTVAGAVLPWLGMQRSLIGMTEGQLDRSSIESAMAANFGIPGVYWNKQAVNRFGDPLGNRTWFGRIGDTGVPLAFQVAETSENQQFYRTLAQKGAAPPELRRYVAEEKYGPLTDDQFSDLARRSGAMLKRAVSQNLSGLERMTPEQVKDYMGKVAGQSDRTAAMALGLTAVKPATRTTAAVETETVPLLPTPRRLSSGRVRAAIGRSRGIGRARSRIGRTRLATMRVPRLRAGRARAYLTRSRSFRRPRRVRSAMSRIRRPRFSYV